MLWNVLIIIQPPCSLASARFFERVIFNHLFAFLESHNLIFPRQSGFTPGDSTVNQLIALCHSISTYLLVDNGDEVIGVLLPGLNQSI